MRGEDLGGGDAAEIAPVVAIGGGRDCGVVVADVLAEKKVGAVCKDSVVPSEAFFSQRLRGDEEEVADTEA